MKKNLPFICLLFLLSCAKENCIDGDSQAPIIMLTAPANGTVFRTGETITVKANISDNQKLRKIHLEIINTATGAFITHEHYSPEGKDFLINRTFAAQGSASYKIKIEAEDMAQNKAKAETSIISN